MKQLVRLLAVLLALVLLVPCMPAVAEQDNRIAPTEVWITDEPPEPSTIAPTSFAMMGVKRSYQLYAGLYPFGASSKLTWRSSDTSVLTVNRKGKVNIKKPGQAVVTVSTSNHLEASISITAVRLASPLFSARYWHGKPSEKRAYNALMRMKKQYPTGMRWNDDDWYELRWPEQYPPEGYVAFGACKGFAHMMGEAAFGNRPVRFEYKRTSKLLTGDIVELWSHTFIVLGRTGNAITIAEGNYDGKVNWGRVIPLDILSETVAVYTRY